MLTLHDLIPLFLAGIVLALKPGPYLIALTSLAAKGHIRALFFFWVGAITAVSLIYFIVLSGFNIIPENYGVLFIFLKAIAAMTFVAMGIKALKENEEFSDEEIEERAKKISVRDAFSNIFAGFTLGLSNPVDILFIFTAIPSLVSITVFSLRDIFLIRGTIILADILILCVYCIPLLLLRRKIPKTKFRQVRMFCGLAMIGIGVFLMVNIILQYDLIKSGLINIF